MDNSVSLLLFCSSYWTESINNNRFLKSTWQSNCFNFTLESQTTQAVISEFESMFSEKRYLYQVLYQLSVKVFLLWWISADHYRRMATTWNLILCCAVMAIALGKISNIFSGYSICTKLYPSLQKKISSLKTRWNIDSHPDNFFDNLFGNSLTCSVPRFPSASKSLRKGSWS